MSNEKYDELIKRLPEMAKAINAFKSEVTKTEALRGLIAALNCDRATDSNEGDGEEGYRASKLKKLGEKGKTAWKPKSKTQDSPEDSLDVQSIINRLRERDDYGSLNSKIFHKNDLWNKIRTVMYFTDKHISSGEITKILVGLDLRTSAPSISRKLKECSSFLVTTAPRKAGSKTKYKLSGPSRTATEEWLSETTA